MRPKPPPHRGEVCALSALCALSPRIGGFCPPGQEPEGGRPSTPGRGVAVFFGALAFSLSANSLLTAVQITSALMLYCSRLRQEPCCPPGPNPPSRGAVSKNALKARYARLASLARSNAKCTAAWPRRSADDPEGPPKRKGSARWCSIRSKLSSGNADRYVCFRVTSAVCRR